MAADTHKTTKMTSAGNKADVIQVVVTKPYDGIKEGYWKKID